MLYQTKRSGLGCRSETNLKIGNQKASLNSYSLLFDADYGEGNKGGEPGWAPPVQDGRCVKLGFPIGDENPQSITLTIPTLEQSTDYGGNSSGEPCHGLSISSRAGH